MIYQCYFKEEQKARLYTAEPYQGFGLEPDVNPSLVIGCPELSDPETRLALCEYGAFLHLWRNPALDSDSWIGFTSFRQEDKTRFVFDSKQQIGQLLNEHDLLAWNVWSVRGARIGSLTGAAAQAEIAHAGLHVFTMDVLNHFGIQLPRRYQEDSEVPYANYWILNKTAFRDFMAWSWPLVQHALHVSHPYKKDPSNNPMDNKSKSVGYFMERLFIIWTMRAPLRSKWLGEIRHVSPSEAVPKAPWYKFWH